jgi:hypothetical protein
MDRQAWLDQVVEETLEPDLPICDPHHHLWDYPESRYLLDELLEDTNSGHKVVSTVFMECGAMYRAAGPEAFSPVGETEFVNGIAAMSASGLYGETRACASIIGFADLSMGTVVAFGMQRAGMPATISVIHTRPHRRSFLGTRFFARGSVNWESVI